MDDKEWYKWNLKPPYENSFQGVIEVKPILLYSRKCTGMLISNPDGWNAFQLELPDRNIHALWDAHFRNPSIELEHLNNEDYLTITAPGT